ncbi:trypsin-like peptidase domain-containing protein [Mycobacterium sp. Marseille-P9652]|uniref:trypsin-like peptidase domain-containing protein n=1 Tax=Mycobacterium sp. Marseille-P9652 TaxID=2654950 RepID=UPI0012E85670|nr:trypsin-like peptidase domain-containing protein [Mycobacterium sp. Marseille-P9652]
MPKRAGCGRALAVMSAAVLAMLVGAPGIASANNGYPRVNPEERAAAMIRPAVMYLGGQGYGGVRLPNGQILSQFGQGTNMPFIATWACTAFVVNPDGWVATAGHCVDPESAKVLILKRAAAEYMSQYPDAPESHDPASALDWLRKNARVYGDSADRGPEIGLTLMYGSGVNIAGKVPAGVVDFRPLGKGDVALLKIDKHNLPSSELAADSDVSIGTPILAVGYPESTRNVTGPSLDPTNKSGKVSKKSTMGPSPEYEIDAAVSEGMSGGPAIQLDGKVIGVNSFAPIGEPQAFNFVSPADGLAAILASKGVKPMLGPADAFYRKGLAHYYSGHYTEAIEDFDQTLAMSPDYPGLLDLKTSAVNLRQQYGDASAFGGAILWWYLAASVGLVLAAGAGLTFLVLRADRHRRGGAKGSGLKLVSGSPGGGAVRPRRGIKLGAARLIGVAPAPKPVTPPHYCSACGAEHQPAESFCPNCGKRIAAVVEADAAR